MLACNYKYSYIILKPSIANRVIEAEIGRRFFSFLGSRKQILREHTIDDYKSDLYINDTDTIVEIKSVISCEKTAVFPTVYSERTLKQLLQIEARLEKGRRVCMLIVALNPYIRNVQINKGSELSNTLQRCISKGLSLHAFSCRLEKEKGVYIDKSLKIFM